MATLMSEIKRLFNSDEAAALIEYGFLVGLIAAVCVAAVTTLGGQIGMYFNNINAAI